LSVHTSPRTLRQKVTDGARQRMATSIARVTVQRGQELLAQLPPAQVAEYLQTQDARIRRLVGEYGFDGRSVTAVSR